MLSGKAIRLIEESPIRELTILDNIALKEERKIPKIRTLSVAPVLAEAIARSYEERSVSPLFG